MQQTRTVVVADRRGGPEVLRVRTEPLPAPAAGQVQIDVARAGVAYGDLLLREGLVPGSTPPRSPGYDAVGVVSAVGDGVADFVIGDRVAVRTVGGTGGYSSSMNASAELAVPIPDAVGFEPAAALVVNYVTAWQMLTRSAVVPRGSTVLVHGASSGVGRALTEIAGVLGISAYGTASASRLEALAERGVPSFDRAGRWDRDVAGVVPGGVRAVFDGSGGATARRSLRLLAPGGTLVEYGVSGALRGGRRSLVGLLGAAISSPRPSALRLFSRGVTVAGYASAAFVPAHPTWFRDDLRHLLDLVAGGSLAPQVAHVLPLEDAVRAHVLQAAGVSGKILLRPGLTSDTAGRNAW